MRRSPTPRRHTIESTIITALFVAVNDLCVRAARAVLTAAQVTHAAASLAALTGPALLMAWWASAFTARDAKHGCLLVRDVTRDLVWLWDCVYAGCVWVDSLVHPPVVEAPAPAEGNLDEWLRVWGVVKTARAA